MKLSSFQNGKMKKYIIAAIKNYFIQIILYFLHTQIVFQHILQYNIYLQLKRWLFNMTVKCWQVQGH